mgnify:FL=1
MNEFRKVHQFNAFSCHSPVQVAMAGFLKDKSHYLSLPAFMQDRRDHFRELMSQTRFGPLESHGSYFQLYSYSGISDAPDFDFARELVAHHGVAAIPVSAFYQSGKDDKVLRFCFAKKKETLELAVEKLLRV